MSVSAGFSTDRNGILDIIRIFCLSNGWTINQFGVKGTGYLLCMQKTTATGHTVYTNIRSMELEDPGVTVNSNVNDFSGLMVSGSTGYDASKDVWNQPGVPISTVDNTRMYLGLVTPLEAVSAYWMFAVPNPEMIAVVMRLPDGQYRHFAFGDVYKQCAFTGGQYFFTSNGVNTTIAHDGLPFEFNHVSGSSNGSAFMRADFDARSGWWDASSMSGYAARNHAHLNTSGGIAGAKFLDQLALDNCINAFSGLGILFPINLYAYYDSINKYKPFGYLPWIRTTLKAAFIPGQILTLGDDSWQILPSLGDASPYSLAYKYVS